MKLDYEKLYYCVNSFPEIDDGDSVLPYQSSWDDAPIHLIVAYMWLIIGNVILTEDELREWMANDGFGNTEIISVVVNDFCEGACEVPLWQRDDQGVLRQLLFYQVP